MPRKGRRTTILARPIAAIAALLAAPAAADNLPAAGSPVAAHAVNGGRESHAWVVVPDSDGEGSILLHIPPRGVIGGFVVPDGFVQVAARIDEPPEQIAAWGATVYLAFPPQVTRQGAPPRRVLRVTATPSALGDAWRYDADKRLQAEPSIPAVGGPAGEGRLLGFVGAPEGPVALLEDRAPETAGVSLLMLADDRWHQLSLPSGEGPAPGGAPPPILVATPEGPALLLRSRATPGLWRARFEPRETGAPPRVRWHWQALAWRSPVAASLSGPVYEVRGRIIAVDREGPGTLAFYSSAGEGSPAAHLLARLSGLPADCAVAPLGQSARLVVVCPVRTDEPRPGSAPPAPRYEYHVREISAITGRELFAGGPSRPSFISPTEFRLMVLVLLGLMVGIMLFILKPAGPGGRTAPLILPQRAVLAEPGRRVAAAALDLALATALASRFAGVPLAEVLFLDDPIAGDLTLVVLLDALGIAFVHTTICEWFFGRSLGKALLGCEVAQVVIRPGPGGEPRPELARPALWRAIVRSATKWALAPIAFAGLSGPERRHLGDRLSGTVVVVREPAEAEGQ